MLLPFLHTRHLWRKVQKMNLYIAYHYLTLEISVQLRNPGSTGHEGLDLLHT